MTKFTGTEQEDYDVWWDDLQAFFDLYEFSENEKVKLLNAHFGGDARKFIQDEDLINIDTAKKLDKLLIGTFQINQIGKIFF